jgi:PAS domain S-box-containing protein
MDDEKKTREQLLAEVAQLRETAARYRSLVDALPDAITVTDIEGRITEVSAQTAELYRGKVEDLLGRSGFDPIVPEEREIAVANMMRVAEGEVLRGLVYTLLRADGSTYQGEMNAAAIRGPCGEPRGFIASVRDVTARVKAEEALRESEEKFRALADRSPNMIFINQTGRVVYANDKSCEMMGYTREEFLAPDFDFRRLIAPESLPTIHDAFARHGRGQDVSPYEYVLLTKDLRRIDAIIATRLMPYGGRPAILGIVTDITERKRMETELQKADKLESLGILAGGIAHDFNNTLAIIAGNASLARRIAPPGSELAQMLEEIEHASLQGRQLTRQLLTFAKGGAPVKRLLSLGTLLRETLDFSLSGSNVTARLDVAEDLWTVDVDEGQFVQVFNNLTLNAQQAMPGGGRLDVAAANLEVGTSDRLPLCPGRYVHLSFRDHGVGIPQALRTRIFDPFFTTKPGGTGLGLSTVYSILRRHDGHVEVESTEGAGATFHIYIPASTGEAVRARRPSSPGLRPGRGRVLVMDDEEQVLGIVARFLAICGYDPEVTRNGEELLTAFRRARVEGRPFDVVILDLVVPDGMGGKEALTRLREIDPQVRAIVSSGYSEDPVMADYAKHGFRGVLTKPYDLAELNDLLRRLFDEPSPTPTAE